MTWVHGSAGVEGPDAWHADDALLVPLTASDGRPLALLSLDDPVDGRRPSDGALEVLSAVAAIAASVIEHGQLAAEAARHRTAVEHLLRVSSELTTSSSRAEMLGAVCEGIRDALGFEKAAVFLDEEGDGRLVPAAIVGLDDVGQLGGFTTAGLDAMMAPETEREGCVLLDNATAHAMAVHARRPDRVRLAQQRPRRARLGPPLADGAAARPLRHAAGLPVGRRSGRPAAPRRRRPARPARVRQPRGRRDRGGAAARAPARARRPRPAHRAAQPPRVRAGAGEAARPDRARDLRPRPLQARQRHARAPGRRRRAPPLRRPAARPHARGRRGGPARRRGVRARADRRRRARGTGRRRAPAPRGGEGVPRVPGADLGLGRHRRRPDPARMPRRSCAPPTARCSRPSAWAATAASSTTPRRSRCSTRSPRTAAASSSPPRCCWPRRSTCATSPPPATPRPSGATPS